MRLGLAVALVLALTSSAAMARHRGGHDGFGREMPGYANPSALIADEIALSQLAREKGQWKALRDTAAPGAVMFVPEKVNADKWLKGRKSPPAAAKWAPYRVWMSCDGSFGVVEGGRTENGASSHYAAVWQHQKDGGYKWLIRRAIGQAGPVKAPDMLSATVADCDKAHRRRDSATRQAQPSQPAAVVEAQSGYSTDRTLHWRSGKDAAGIPRILVQIRQGGQMRSVLGQQLEQQPGH